MKILKNLIILLAVTLSFGLLTSCSKSKEATNVVTVGIIDGPATATWEVAQKIALKKYGLHIQLVKFSDYTVPNVALNDGDIDANAFQHVPFLKAQIQSRGFNIIPIAKTFIYPIAMYSNKIKKLSQLKSGSKIAIPNDPSNEARALLLLQQAGLIKLRKGAGIDATPVDIISNPKNLNIVELGAAQLPRVLDDVTAAIITNDFAGPAGLNPKNGLLIESPDSPYMNIIAIRPGEKNSKKIKEMILSFQTPEVKAVSEKISNGNAIAGF